MQFLGKKNKHFQVKTTEKNNIVGEKTPNK